MTIDENAPIACTLGAGDFKDRTGWIRELARQSLRKAERTPLVLSLTYAPEAATKVRELVRKEQSCCGFLTFALAEDATGIRLTITAPERAREVADELFAHFAPDAAASNNQTSELR